MRKQTVRRSRSTATSPAANSANELGGRLRAARLRAAETVRGLARRVKVSPSLISQIELGRVQPSVGTLYAISNELGLSLADIFREDPPRVQPRSQDSRERERVPAAPANAGPVLRSKGRKTIRLDGGVRWEQLTATTDPHLEFLYIVYEVGGSSCAEDALIRHGGKEYGYIVSGRLGFKIGFEDFELGPGDSFSFDAQMPHRLWTIGNEPAVAIWAVFNRHGDSRKRGS